MNEQNAQRVLIGTFFLACATIAWTEIKKESTVPAPYRFFGAGLVYGILAVISPFVGPAAALLGVGYYIVLLYVFFGADLLTEGADSVGKQTAAASKAITAGGQVGKLSPVITLHNGQPG